MMPTRCDKCGNIHSGTSLLCRDCYITLKATEARYPMTTDPRDAEIARLNREIELLRVHRDIVWETPVGYWQDRAEKAEARITELEAALTPLPDVGLDAAMPQTDDRRTWDDDIPDGYLESNKDWADRNDAAVTWLVDNHAAIRAALAVRDRRDAQLRAEGRKEGLRKAADLCKPKKVKMRWGDRWAPSIKNPQSAAAQDARKQCYDAILAEAEKEENG